MPKQPDNCPQGHTTRWQGKHPVETPVCDECGTIGTHYNARTGEVFEWTDQEEHRQNCERMQAEIDAAFDNQYFGGGW